MIEREIFPLKDGDIVPFQWRTKEYGRAEFTFCLVWKKMRLVEVWITPKQQPDATTQYHIRGLQCTDFQTYAYTHEGSENPWVWKYGWCRDHKCQYMHAYVPPQSKQFRIQILSSFSVIFE